MVQTLRVVNAGSAIPESLSTRRRLQEDKTIVVPSENAKSVGYHPNFLR